MGQPTQHDTARRRATSVALACAAVWVGAGSGAAQESDRLTIVGRVVDHRTELPVLGAVVGLTVRGSGVMTDEDGRFVIQVVPSESYMMFAGALGYEDVAFELRDAALDTEILIRLEPNPIALEGIKVMTDRFERRRRRVAVSARAYDKETLLSSGAQDLLDYLRFRDGMALRPCASLSGRFGEMCTMQRGREAPVTVYIDERPAWGGADELASYQVHEMYLVEVYGRGRQIRAYTNYFMDRIAKSGRPLSLFPVFW